MDEVTIPSVHFVETAAGDYIGERQIQEPLLLDLREIGELADLDLLHVGGGHLTAQLGFDLARIFGGGHVNRPAAIGQRREFGIDGSGGEVAVGTGERGPGAADIILDGFGLLLGSGLGGEDSRKQGGQKYGRETAFTRVHEDSILL